MVWWPLRTKHIQKCETPQREHASAKAENPPAPSAALLSHFKSLIHKTHVESGYMQFAIVKTQTPYWCNSGFCMFW